jgi:peroxiredoxin
MLSAGETAPAVELDDIDGDRHSLADALAAGPVLLAFFALDCLTCELSYDFWDRIHIAYAGAAFELWGVALDDAESVRAFEQQSGVEFPLLLDEGLAVVRAYGPASTPALFLIEHGAVTASHEGFDRLALNAIARTVAEHTGMPPIEIVPGEAPDLRPGCMVHDGSSFPPDEATG